MPTPAPAPALRRAPRRNGGLWMIALLLWMDTATATKCKTPERPPTAAEQAQLAEFQRQTDAARTALSHALHADPVLGPQLPGLARVGWHFFDPLAPAPDPEASIDEALRLAGQDELLALALLQSRPDLDPAQQHALSAQWRDRGLPWTVLAAVPADLAEAAERDRYRDLLRQSLALPLNNALAIRVREFGIRYFALAERHPEPRLAASLRSVSGSCLDWRWMVQLGLLSLTLEATSTALDGWFEAECSPPDIALEAICRRWSTKLRAESLVAWVASRDSDRPQALMTAVADCSPLTVLRAVQAHAGDWPRVEAALRACPRSTADAESD